MEVRQFVRDAISTFVAPEGFRLAPRGRLNSSIIFSYGVRLCERDDPRHYWWVCLASEDCQAAAIAEATKAKSRINMRGGNTSKCTVHLSVKHRITASKTEVAEATTQRRNDLHAKYTASATYSSDPRRFVVLLETMRVVVNNLPFRSVEYEESVMIRKLCYRDAVQPILNAKIVMHTLLELYVSAKREIVGIINRARMPVGACFSLVTDFWTSKVQNKKYVGVRLYFVDSQFIFRSILLGTRQFDPKYGDRSRPKCLICPGRASCNHTGHGIRYPFRRWIVDILRDFGLQSTDLFGATSDGGSDVKWMMSNGFHYQWEWCVAHLSNAATKAACGLVDDAKKSNNKGMTKLQKKIVATVYQTKHVEVMGSLFQELCATLSEDQTTQLLDYRSHRFLGLTRVIDRIIVKWEVLKEWYSARQLKAAEDGKPRPEFPLEGHEDDLIQLLSILDPITANNATAQAESPVQVTVLLGLFRIYMTVVNPEVPLRDHRSLPRPAIPDFFAPEQLTPLVATTRQLLCEAFHARFFKRYTSADEMRQCSYVFEQQMLLHPDFKSFELSLKPVVLLCHQHHRAGSTDHEEHYEKLVKCIKDKLIATMAIFVKPPTQGAARARPRGYIDENLEMFGVGGGVNLHQVNQDATAQATQELTLWLSDATHLRREEQGPGLPPIVELVTQYWSRQKNIARYKLLPLAARSLFSVPSSSAQLERDFGVSGMQVTAQRASTAAHNVDMCAFVNRNREYIDLTQCKAIAADDRIDFLPTNVLVDLDPYDENDIDFDAPNPVVYSNTLLDDEEEQKENDVY